QGFEEAGLEAQGMAGDADALLAKAALHDSRVPALRVGYVSQQRGPLLVLLEGCKKLVEICAVQLAPPVGEQKLGLRLLSLDCFVRHASIVSAGREGVQSDEKSS